MPSIQRTLIATTVMCLAPLAATLPAVAGPMAPSALKALGVDQINVSSPLVHVQARGNGEGRNGRRGNGEGRRGGNGNGQGRGRGRNNATPQPQQRQAAPRAAAPAPRAVQRHPRSAQPRPVIQQRRAAQRRAVQRRDIRPRRADRGRRFNGRTFREGRRARGRQCVAVARRVFGKGPKINSTMSYGYGRGACREALAECRYLLRRKNAPFAKCVVR